MSDKPRLPPSWEKRHRRQLASQPGGSKRPPLPGQGKTTRGWGGFAGRHKVWTIGSIIMGVFIVAAYSNSRTEDTSGPGILGERPVALCDEPRSELESLAQAASGVLRNDGIEESSDEVLAAVANSLPVAGPCAPWFPVYVELRRAQP